MPTVKGDEIVFVRGEGAYLWTEGGVRYFDAPASLWCCNVGHGRSEIAEAVARQMSTLEAYSTFGQFATAPTLAFAERLLAAAPVANAKVFLTSGGSDAIETAAKLVRRYWSADGHPERTILVTREGAYHGMHGFGTSIVGLGSMRQGYGPLIEDVALIPPHDPDALASLVERHPDRIAAFFCEPIHGSGGVVYPAAGYLESVQAICKEHGIFFVVDEVITGFGRTGEAFASDLFDLDPDVLVVAKGLTSGYFPLGATIVGERLWEPFWADDSDQIFYHGVTYSGHAAGCAAAMVNLDILEREQLVPHVRSLGPVLARALDGLRGHELVRDVRAGIGLIAGLELVDEASASKVARRALDAGVVARVLAGRTLQISPPFVASEADISFLVEAVHEALETALEQAPVA